MAQQTEGSCLGSEGKCLMTPQGAEDTTRVYFVYEEKVKDTHIDYID